MRRKYEPPTSEEIKTLVKKYNVKMSTCAYIACVSLRTFERYVEGKSTMNALSWKKFESEVKRLK